MARLGSLPPAMVLLASVLLLASTTAARQPPDRQGGGAGAAAPAPGNEALVGQSLVASRPFQFTPSTTLTLLLSLMVCCSIIFRLQIVHTPGMSAPCTALRLEHQHCGPPSSTTHSPSVPRQVSALSNATGVGGGAIFVPLFNVLLLLPIKLATALSQAVIAGGALGEQTVPLE